MAKALGDRRLSNTIMLGTAAARLPFSPAALKRTLLERFTADHPMRTLNARAFDAGAAVELGAVVMRSGDETARI
jgi:indolepyruvate ferredoxin oxidoreductase beta subunit